jgi:hypothetical protein
MKTTTSTLAIMLALYAGMVVYVDSITSHEVYGCSEDNLTREQQDVCTKLLRTKYHSTKPSKGLLQRTQQEQSSGVFRKDTGIIKDRRGDEVGSNQDL